MREGGIKNANHSGKRPECWYGTKFGEKEEGLGAVLLKEKD